MNTDKSTPELFAALAKAQGEVENATKGSVNPHFRSKYADLAAVLNTIRPLFAKHGLSFLQSTAFDGAMVHVHSVLAHSSGGLVSSVASCVPAKTDAQGVGAATTYLRRYSAAAMGGIAQEDDDGQSAAHNTPPMQSHPEYESYLEAIDGADAETLADIAAELAKSSLPAPLKSKLRAAFSARKHSLAQAAA